MNLAINLYTNISESAKLFFIRHNIRNRCHIFQNQVYIIKNENNFAKMKKKVCAYFFETLFFVWRIIRS